MSNRNLFAWLIVAIMAAGTIATTAAASTSATTYTGCLNQAGSLKYLALGEQPAKPCSATDTMVSLSGGAQLYDGRDFARAGQSCGAGDVVTGVDADGRVSCAPDTDTDTDTQYTGADFALSNQAWPAPQKATGVSSFGTLLCGADQDTTYSGANFALSNQGCGAGQLVRAINAGGQTVCEAPPTGGTTAWFGTQATQFVNIADRDDPTRSTVVTKDVPAGTYLIAYSIEFWNGAAVAAQDNRRQVECVIEPTGASNSWSVHEPHALPNGRLTATAFTVAGFGAPTTIAVTCRDWAGGTDQSFVSAARGRLVAIPLTSLS